MENKTQEQSPKLQPKGWTEEKWKAEVDKDTKYLREHPEALIDYLRQGGQIKD